MIPMNIPTSRGGVDLYIAFYGTLSYARSAAADCFSYRDDLVTIQHTSQAKPVMTGTCKGLSLRQL